MKCLEIELRRPGKVSVNGEYAKRKSRKAGKKCGRCRQSKLYCDFHKNKNNTIDGYTRTCRECATVISGSWIPRIKLCGKCHKLLPEHHFSRMRQSKDRLQTKCRKCYEAYYLDRRKKRHPAPEIREESLYSTCGKCGKKKKLISKNWIGAYRGYHLAACRSCAEVEKGLLIRNRKERVSSYVTPDVEHYRRYFAAY